MVVDAESVVMQVVRLGCWMLSFAHGDDGLRLIEKISLVSL